MRRRTTRTRIVAFALLVLALPAVEGQEGDRESPGDDPDGVVLEVGDREVTRAEFARYLLDHFGRRAIDRFVRDLLVTEEAARRGCGAGSGVGWGAGSGAGSGAATAAPVAPLAITASTAPTSTLAPS